MKIEGFGFGNFEFKLKPLVTFFNNLITYCSRGRVIDDRALSLWIIILKPGLPIVDWATCYYVINEMKLTSKVGFFKFSVVCHQQVATDFLYFTTKIQSTYIEKEKLT